MKPWIIILLLCLLAGCAQLQRGEIQLVEALDDGAYFTSCSGAVEDWFSCVRKARQTCDNGSYETLKKIEDANGGRRELTFKCR